MKNIIISEGQTKINGMISEYLADKGHNVILLSNEEPNIVGDPRKYETKVLTLNSEESINTFCKEIEQRYGNIDVLIHGISDFHEEYLLEQNPEEFSEYIRAKLKEVFLLSKSVTNRMVMKKQGLILYPMLLDTLSFAGYPVSPIMNHAKISMMKCLARELNAFKVRANAITFGYYDDDFDKEKSKKIRKDLEIFALKPKLNKIQEYVSAIDIFFGESAALLSGQNIHVGAGTETCL